MYKKLCASLRWHATNIIRFEKTSAIDKKSESYKHPCICDRRFLQTLTKDKIHQKVRDHCHYTVNYVVAVHRICNLRHNVPNEIPVTFQNGSNYYFHFITKELTTDFEGKFECLRKNTEN